MTPRRQITLAVLGGLAGAGLAVYAATRVWLTETTARREPLPPVTTEHTGADLAAWIVPLAVVSLAGSVALVAVRGKPRRALAVLLALAGLGAAAGGIRGLAEAPGVWPAATAIGGFAVAAAGVYAFLRGAAWPHMSSRYERAATAPSPQVPGGEAVADDPVDLWNALDRGEDPTSLNIAKTAPGEGSSG